MKHAMPITCHRQIVPQVAETSLQTKLNFIRDFWKSLGPSILNIKYF